MKSIAGALGCAGLFSQTKKSPVHEWDFKKGTNKNGCSCCKMDLSLNRQRIHHRTEWLWAIICFSIEASIIDMTNNAIPRYHPGKSRQNWCQKTLDIASLLAIGKDEVARGPSSWFGHFCHGTVSDHLRSNPHDNPWNVVIFNDQSQWLLPDSWSKFDCELQDKFMDGDFCSQGHDLHMTLPWIHPCTNHLLLQDPFASRFESLSRCKRKKKNYQASSWGKDCQ